MATLTERSLTALNVKVINRKLVMGALYSPTGLTKMQLVQNLKMSLSTVDQNLKDLLSAGIIEELGFCHSTGGRKAKLLHVKSRLKVAVGIFALKHEVRFIALDLYGNPIGKACIALDFACSSEYLTALNEHFVAFLHHHAIKREELLPLRFAVQGLVDTTGQKVTFGRILHNESLTAAALSEALDCEVMLCHDAFAAAFWEVLSHPGLEDAVLMLLNRNFGGALIIDGKVLTGLHGRSGVIEHYCVDPHGPRCYCGAQGCLECYCSAEALTRLSGKAAAQFFTALRDGDIQALELWEEYLQHLALAARNCLCLVDGKLILSGYLSAFLIADDIARLCQYISQGSAIALKPCDVIISKAGDETAALGAAHMALQEFLHAKILPH
ncbi:MAG: ROK family protein [Candidatus Anaerobiospirillum merdipullorum]|uniref:ROK family protein n=1 Tax=Candidatus Anaerobiospirillum merdipullorum TaxID=2838450 RepID=A0A9E2KPY7_9GAMM|nr:ROK family protein [Candidatus Anaerobiospirillum merdipullorum]